MSLVRCSRLLPLSNFSRVLLVSSSPCSVRVFSSSTGAGGGSTGEDDIRKKESTHEQEYAARHERQVLQDMLRRMEKDADPGDVKAKAALNTIFTQNGVKGTNKLIDDLLKWKHTTSFPSK